MGESKLSGISPFLTRASYNVLKRMADGEELTWAKPGGWWLEDTQIKGSTGLHLLRYCLISESWDSGRNYVIYVINSDGEKILNDSKYVPLIVGALEKRPKERQLKKPLKRSVKSTNK